MSRSARFLVLATCIAFGLTTVDSVAVGQGLKGKLRGDADFADAALGPLGPFSTDNAEGHLVHVGKTSAMLEMSPGPLSDGTMGFSGFALLEAPDGAMLPIAVETGNPEIFTRGAISTATYVGTYEVPGGTGEAAGIVIIIECHFGKRPRWSIIIQF